MVTDTDGARSLTDQSDVVGIASKGGDVVTHPGQCQCLVPQSLKSDKKILNYSTVDPACKTNGFVQGKLGLQAGWPYKWVITLVITEYS